jgi:polysaccharide export outer membrane protein
VLALRAAAVCAGGATAALPVAAQDSARGAGDAARAVVVGVGDRVRLKVWREAALSDEFTVDERGEVAFPRLGVLRVAGLPIATLHDSLVTRYAEYLRDPSMSVTVLRRVGVQGEVRAPNLYYVDATKSLRELLTEAGGVNESGDSRRVVIVRDGRTLRVGRAMNQPAFAADLRSGDQVVVPRRSWWSRNAIAALSTAGFALSAALSLLNSLR